MQMLTSVSWNIKLKCNINLTQMRVTAEFLQRLSCFFFHNNDNISEIKFPDQSAPIFAIANLMG